MSADQDIPEEPDAALVEGLAKQLFRAENPPDMLWDTALFERMGRSTEGFRVATQDLKDAYMKRAHEALLNQNGDAS